VYAFLTEHAEEKRRPSLVRCYHLFDKSLNMSPKLTASKRHHGMVVGNKVALAQNFATQSLLRVNSSVW
jgi:hypothetical protein